MSQSDVSQFKKTANELLELYRRGEYESALRFVSDVASTWPRRGGTIAYWIACLRCLTGDPDEALRALQAAIDEGHFWPEALLMNEPDLRMIQDRIEFASIIEWSRQLRNISQAQARRELIVEVPVDHARGMLVCLHGSDGRGEDCAPTWAAATYHGFIVAALQSSQVVSDEGFCWDDLGRTIEDLDSGLSQLATEYGIKTDSIVLAGYSQSANRAIQFVLRPDPIPVRHIFCVGPGFKQTELDQLIPQMTAARKRGVRAFLVVGGRDPRREMCEQLNSSLQEHGIASELHIIPELGHDFPTDFETWLTRGLQFLQVDGPS